MDNTGPFMLYCYCNLTNCYYNMSDRFTLDKADALNILKVAVYSAASALIAGVIALVDKAHVPTTWIWLIPSVNTALVALKKLLDAPTAAV